MAKAEPQSAPPAATTESQDSTVVTDVDALTDAPRGFVTRLADVGSVAQASVPGLYAWAVTVAPVAWSRGAPGFARVFAVFGVLALGAAVVLEGTGRLRPARLLSVWGLSLASAIVWAVAPAATVPGKIDVARGISGMLGWGLFAYACAAPTFRRSPAAPSFDEGDDLRARAASPRGDRFYFGAAALGAIGLQLIGWAPMSPERALLVRLVTIAAAVGLVTQASVITLARHKRGRAASASSRRRAVIRGLAAVGIVSVLGLLVLLIR
jgi:hypothetical protein